MVRSLLFAYSLGFVSLGAVPAGAHFIWIDLKSDASGGQQVQVYFSEPPVPGESHLIGKISHTKPWVRTAAGESTDLQLSTRSDNSQPAMLCAACPAAFAASVEATCDYGVYAHGASGVLLQYYAKHLAGGWSTGGADLVRATQLAYDIVPTLSGQQLTLQVFFGDRPSDADEVVVIDPAGQEREMKTDANGRVAFDIVAAGRYSIRAAHIQKERGGERQGKTFSETWHYSTLTLEVPSTTATPADVRSAAEVLQRARDDRSMWRDFPGFTAELMVTAEGQQVCGSATIGGDGAVNLKMPESPLAEWAAEQLRSLVQHRMPDGEVSTGNVTFSDHDRAHPLGRRVDLGDPELQSAYRIKDDAIMEVNRSMGDLRFTISVLEIFRNAEHKYLPRSFTMTFFDAKSGQLRSTLTYRNDWQRVGQFDLPKLILEIGTEKEQIVTRQIVFENCRLSD